MTGLLKMDDLDTLQLLLLYSPNYWDLNDLNAYDESLLETASREGHLPIVEFLVDRGASLAPTGITPAIHLATGNGHIDIVRFLLDKGADTSIRCGLRRAPLHVAVQNRHTEIVSLLLGRGVCVDNPWNEELWTPLHIAIDNDDTIIMELLINHGANISAVVRHY